MTKENISEGNLDRAMNGDSANKIFYSAAKTISLGSESFENIRVEFGQAVAVPDGESFAEHKEKLRAQVMDELADMVEEIEGATK